MTTPTNTVSKRKRVMISLRLPPELIQNLRTICEAKGITQTDFIEACLDEAINKHLGA